MIYRQLPPENCDERRRYEPLPVIPRWQRVALVALLSLLVAAVLVGGLAAALALS